MLNHDNETGNQVRGSRTKALAKWVLRLLLGVVLILILIKWKGSQIGSALSSASWTLLATTVAFYLASQFLSALRWRLLFNSAMSAGEKGKDAQNHLGLWEAYRIYLIGMFWNLWMPTAIGGDAMRAYLASRRCGDLPLAASTVFMERLTGFVALITIGIGGALFFAVEVTASSGGAGTGVNKAIGIAGLALLLLLGVILVVIAARKMAYRLEGKMGESEPSGIGGKLGKLWIKAHRALDLFTLPQTRMALVQAVLISLVFQGCQVVLGAFIAGQIGLHMPLAVFAWLVPCLGIASMLPLGIGGLGVREMAAVALLSNIPPQLFKTDPGQVIAWSLLWQATLWLSALPGALAHALGDKS